MSGRATQEADVRENTTPQPSNTAAAPPHTREGQVHTSLSLSHNPVPDHCLTSPPGFARTHQHTTMYQQGPEAYACLSLSLSRRSNALPKQLHRACHTWPKDTNIHPSILSAKIIGVYSTARLEVQHTHVRRSLSTTRQAQTQQLACLRH